jgi:hypothetical protein
MTLCKERNYEARQKPNNCAVARINKIAELLISGQLHIKLFCSLISVIGMSGIYLVLGKLCSAYLNYCVVCGMPLFDNS